MMGVLKSGIRAIGIDDGPGCDSTLLVGIVMKKDRLEGVISDRIGSEGATKKIIDMVKNSKFYVQIRCVFIDGIAVAGFNLVDFHEVAKTLGVPTIICTQNEPHPEEFAEALKKWPAKQKLWEKIKAPVHQLNNVWYQFSGCSRIDAESLIKHFRVHSGIPEPLRVAHLVATGIEANKKSKPE